MRLPSAAPIAALAIALSTACHGATWSGGPPAASTDDDDGLASATPVVRTPEDDLLSAVSPDGRYLAVTSEVNGNLDVWIRDFASDGFYPLTRSPADDYDPAFAPDARQLALASRRLDAKGDIFVRSLDPGASPRRLTGAESADRQPVYSGDGARIYFTSARGTGAERIESVATDGSDRRVVSPGPGFDPTPLPDGRHLIYTAPADPSRPEPHLVLLRLTDGATTALTRERGPEGFARVVPGADVDALRIVFVRFPDDDDGDGRRSAEDQASLWELRVADVDALWKARERPAPFPLTDGSDDELFPSPGPFFLYFTRGSVQQDVSRIRHDGVFPRYEDPERYFRLAANIEDPRTRWFAYRCVLAVAPSDGEPAARARLAIAALHERQSRLDLAEDVLRPLAERLADSGAAEVGLAQVELLFIERARTAPSRARAEALAARLTAIEARFQAAPSVLARAELERALLAAWSGEAALSRLRAVEERWRGRPEVAARAALERLRLLELTSNPEALGAAYAAVARRYAAVDGVMERASARIVAIHASSAAGARAADEAQAIARVLPRYQAPEMQVELRLRLSQLRREMGQLDAAARELEAALDRAPDRYARARVLNQLAAAYEALERPADAAEAWRALRQLSADFPVYAARAQDALTRADLARAQQAEREGRLEDALDAYQRVVDDDAQQYLAHRRRIDLAARLGVVDLEMERARERVKSDPRTPVHHYVLGLALTYASDPDLDAARKELTRALDLNPQLAPAYLARGWVHEMKELERPGFFAALFSGLGDALTLMFGAGEGDLGGSGWVELAIDDYKRALAANPESADPELEAQISLNLGNAHYRLGDETNDRTNLELAYARYNEALKLGLQLEEPRRAYVFWERLGRSAAWRRAWSDSVQATQRAIELAPRVGLEARLPQLYGNLALAYDQSGEPARAREALERFREQLERRGFEERLALAFRNEGRARLNGPDGHRPETVERALESLELGARALDAYGVDRGETPAVWRPVVADASRAQFGFDERSERALNLALREDAHRRLGDVDLAVQLRARRVALNRQIATQIPKRYLFLNAYLTTLVTLRERVGLEVQEILRLSEAGDADEARSQLDELRAEVRAWLNDPDREADRLAHAVDLARLDALGARLALLDPSAARAPALRERIAESEALLLDAFAPGASSTVAVSQLELPAPLVRVNTSSASVVATASVALAASPLSATARTVQAARARLAWARAGLWTVDEPAEPIAAIADGAPAAWAALDERVRGAGAALDDLREAARRGASAGLGEGALVAAAALAELAAHGGGVGPAPGVLRQAAAQIAEGLGDLDFAFVIAAEDPAFRVASGADAVPCLRLGSPAARSTYAAAVARELEQALQSGELERAFALADASLVARGCRAGPPVRAPARHPEDEPRLLRWRAARADLEAARASLFSAPSSSTARAVAAAVRALRDAEAELQRASDPARHLWLGEQSTLTQVRSALGADEGLLLAVPLEDRVELLWVDGSTRAAPLTHRTSPVSAAALREELHRVWAVDSKPSPTLQRALWGAVPEWARRVLFAGAMVGPPVPQRAAPTAELAHVSAPSIVPLLRAGLSVGGDVAVVVRSASNGATRGASDGPPEAATDEGFEPQPSLRELRWSPAQVAELRTAAPSSLPADFAAVGFELPFELQAGHPERSSFRVGPPPDAGEDDGRLPWSAVALPAPVAVFGRWVAPNAAATTAAWDLDRALLIGGVTTGVLLPDAPSRSLEDVLAELPAADRSSAADRPAAPDPDRPAAPAPGPVVVGLPRRTPAERAAFAAEALPAAQQAALAAVRAGDYVRAAPRLRRWLQLQKAAGATRYLPAVYRALVGLYRNQLEPPDLARAARVQRELVDHFEAEGVPVRQLAEAEITWAELLSEAGDIQRAEAAFAAAFARLESIPEGATEGIASARYRYALHFERHTRLERAVAEIEQAVEGFESSGAYARDEVPSDAQRAASRAGDLYLNRLSDPARAEAAYRRQLLHERDPEARLGVQLDLARVARRRGDLDEAAERARRVEREAEAAGSARWALEAGIERANAAWFRGEYEEAEARCRQSLARADRERERISADARIETAAERRRQLDLVGTRRVYALSVCGLISMRRGRFDEALARLRAARSLAETLEDPAEVATQENNLGRVHLEFGRFPAAAEAFRRARAIDLRRQDVYALAYDDRNLGWALSLMDDPAAEGILRRALAGSREANDRNNEGRTLYALAEHLRRGGRLDEARSLHLRMLELGAGLYDLRWAAQWALGEIASAQSRAEDAAEWYRAAAAEVRRRGAGVARSSAIGPGRQDPYDALVRAALEAGRTAEAFAWAEGGRTLDALVELEEPETWSGWPAQAGLRAAIAATRTATSADGARRRWLDLEAAAPGLTAVVGPSEWERLIRDAPPGRGLLVVRALAREVVAFVVTSSGAEVVRVPVDRAELRRRVATQREALARRAEVAPLLRALADVLWQPVAPRLDGVAEVVIVPHGFLQQVAWSALPAGPEEEPLVRSRRVAFAAAPNGLFYRPDPAAAGLDVLARDPPGAFGFATREAQAIREARPEARLHAGSAATRAAWSAAVSSAGAVHVAAHLVATSTRAAAGRAGAWGLALADGVLPLGSIPSHPIRATRVSLGACGAEEAAREAGLDGGGPARWATALQIAGAHQVVAPLGPVDDVAAAVFGKHLHRAGTEVPLSEAARRAQAATRAHWPHPGWWASFAVWVRAPASEPWTAAPTVDTNQRPDFLDP